MMNIQQFAFRTGLSAHTLRYYDKKGLLKPAMRQENGYRAYSEDQIPAALMIHTLRQADVPMEEIQKFQQADKEQKNTLIQKWRNETEAKMLSIGVAHQYLAGMEADQTRIHLSKWENPAQIVWFEHQERKNGRASLFGLFDQDRKRAVQMGFELGPYAYVKHGRSGSDHWTGQIGFLAERVPSMNLADEQISIEEVPPTVFAVLICATEDQLTLFSYNHFVKRFGFEAQGDKMECYNPTDRKTFQLMVPVLVL